MDLILSLWSENGNLKSFAITYLLDGSEGMLMAGTGSLISGTVLIAVLYQAKQMEEN